jgi:hypothetical protein
MAAGLGFKTFNTGDVLSAADVNGYLMQGILVFASATARDAAITSPQEGQFAFLKDTNVTTYYTGSAWANVDTTGMTNPMTTTGDTIYSSSGSTPARLGIGSTGQVLTVAGGVPSWATPSAASSGMTLISRQTASNVASLSMDSVFSSTYKSYVIYVEKFYAATADNDLLFNLRYGTTDQATAYYGASGSLKSDGTGLTNTSSSNASAFILTTDSASNAGNFVINMNGVGQGSGAPYPAFHGTGFRQEQGNAAIFFAGVSFAAQAYTGIKFKSSSSNITIDVAIYGLAAS